MQFQKVLVALVQTSFVLAIITPLANSANTRPEIVEIATLREENEVGGLEFSADGGQLVALAGAYSRDAHVWNWRKNIIVSTLIGAYAEPTATVPSRASPNGSIWVRCGTSITVWSTETWQLQKTLSSPSGALLPEHPGVCSAVEFSPDGSLLVVLRDALIGDRAPSVVIYETKSWKEQWSISTGPFYVKSVSFANNGQRFAIGGYVTNPASWPYSSIRPTFGTPPLPNTGAIAIVDIAKQVISQIIAVPEASYSSSQTIAWSRSDSSIVYAAADGLYTFDAMNGAFKDALLSEGSNPRLAVYPSPDGRYRIEAGFGPKGDIIRVVDVNATEREVLREISARVRAVTWSRDGRHFALGGSSVSITNLTPLSALLFPSKGKIVIYELR